MKFVNALRRLVAVVAATVLLVYLAGDWVLWPVAVVAGVVLLAAGVVVVSAVWLVAVVVWIAVVVGKFVLALLLVAAVINAARRPQRPTPPAGDRGRSRDDGA